MPLPTEIDQYPSTRLLIRKQSQRRKPRPWPINPARVVDKWQWAWRMVPHLVLPFWTYEDTIWRDISPNRRRGTAAAGQIPAVSGSEMGTRYSFDESNDRIVFPVWTYESDQATIVPSVTILILFRMPDNAGSAFQYFFSHGPINTASTLAVYMREASATSPGQVTCNLRLHTGGGGSGTTASIPAGSWDDGRWHAMAWTFSESKLMRGYMDGRLRVTSSSVAGTGWSPASEIRIGCDGQATPSTDRFFGGEMGLFAIMRGVWTLDQIAAWASDPFGLITPKRGPLIGFRPADTNPDPPGDGQPTRARHRYLPHVGPRFGVN